MNIQELQKILMLHKLWLADDPKGICANLQGAYLQGANLQGAYLRDANLYGAKLLGEDGQLNPTLKNTWKDSFKDAIHFYSVFNRVRHST